MKQLTKYEFFRRIRRKTKAGDRIVGIAIRWLYVMRLLIRFFE